MNETKGKNLVYFALGNEFRFSDKVSAYADWMYSRQDVDRMGVMTKWLQVRMRLSILLR